MKINGKVQQMVKLWNEYSLNMNFSSNTTRLDAEIRKKYGLIQILAKKKIINFKQEFQQIKKSQLDKEHENVKLFDLFPPEILLKLSIQHKCLPAYIIMQDTRYDSSMQSQIVNEIIQNANSLDLISLLKVLRWLCDKSEQSIWKNENSMDHSRLPIFNYTTQKTSRPAIHAKEKREYEDPTCIFFIEKIRLLSQNLNPIIKRRLMLFILHHGRLSEFLIEEFFHFNGNVFEIAQMDISLF